MYLVSYWWDRPRALVLAAKHTPRPRGEWRRTLSLSLSLSLSHARARAHTHTPDTKRIPPPSAYKIVLSADIGPRVPGGGVTRQGVVLTDLESLVDINTNKTLSS